MFDVRRTERPLAVLDFDIEARPLGWYGGDWVHKEVTAIAWAWLYDDELEGEVEVAQLTRKAGSDVRMLKDFMKAYRRADIVTGHYIRGFDLPVLNGAMMEFGLPHLGDVLTQDTKGDLLKYQGQSKSQENLGSILGTPSPKVGMSQADWRAANRLTAEGLELVRERVVGDVRQHIQMRASLKAAGFLTAPKQWTAGEGRMPEYTP